MGPRRLSFRGTGLLAFFFLLRRSGVLGSRLGHLHPASLIDAEVSKRMTRRDEGTYPYTPTIVLQMCQQALFSLVHSAM